ncbi:hypothetical protein CR513_60593, partial [Mucuna pruriens]
MCVDYQGLNKANPKDDFLLPHIDVLVNNTNQHSFFSFMDGFLRYNQFKIVEKDKKTTLINPLRHLLLQGYVVQILSTNSKNMMHREIEVYVDDMISKSRSEEDHHLREFKLRLNPAKCTSGIEVDPDKVWAILEFSPHIGKEVQGF